MFTGLAEGLGLGLATGISCLASCGPIYLSYLLSEKRTGRQSLNTVLLLNLGRFVSYAAFGAVMGLVGGAVPSSVRIPLAYGGYILFSVYLIVSVVRVNRSCGGCGIPKWMKVTKSPVLLGVLTGFSVCPAFLIAMTNAFDSSGALDGALLFTGFFLGTTVYMLPFALFGLFSGRKWLNAVARYAAIFVAVYFAILGVRGLALRYLSSGETLIDSAPRSENAFIYNAMDDDTLYILAFPGFHEDRGTDLFEDLRGADGPVFLLVTATPDDWESAVHGIPELSGVIGPWWIDPRSEAELEPWQEALIEEVDAKGLRLFAVEYEPYDLERAGVIYQYLARFSFRCEPDGGFTFLLTADAGCSTLDCSTCPAFQDN